MNQVRELAKKWNENVQDLSFVHKLDQNDELAAFRDEFLFPKGKHTAQAVYLCGNSLGLQPKSTKAYLDNELKKWAEHGVDGHFVSDLPWVTVDESCVRQMSHIVGAKESEVAIMNSLTVNLHLMMVAFYRPHGKRYKIVIESKAFPSDYVRCIKKTENQGQAAPLTGCRMY